MTEFDAVQLMHLPGLPLSCHLMLGAGERAYLGMISPSLRRIQRGDPFTMACGLWGALNSRAGFVVESAAELPNGIQDYIEKLVAYFEAIVAWYELVGIGITGDELYAAVHERIGAPFLACILTQGIKSISMNGSIHQSTLGQASSYSLAWLCRSMSSRRLAPPTIRVTLKTVLLWRTRACVPNLQIAIPMRGTVYRHADVSCKTSWGSSSSRRCFHSPTSRRIWHLFYLCQLTQCRC